MAQDRLRRRESRSHVKCRLKPRKSLQRGLHRSMKVRLKKWYQSRQNTSIGYLAQRIRPNKFVVPYRASNGLTFSLTVSQPLLFPLSFSGFDLKKDYL